MIRRWMLPVGADAPANLFRTLLSFSQDVRARARRDSMYRVTASRMVGVILRDMPGTPSKKGAGPPLLHPSTCSRRILSLENDLVPSPRRCFEWEQAWIRGPADLMIFVWRG